MRTDHEQFVFIAEQIVEVAQQHRAMLRRVGLPAEARRAIREASREVDLIGRLADEGRLPTAAEVRQLRERALGAAETLEALAGTTPAEREAIQMLRLSYERIAEAAEAITAVRPLVPRTPPEAITVLHPEACPGCGRPITARVEGRTVIVEV